MMVWVDLETTGLDPDRDQILEIGFMLTDDDLTTLGRMSRLVQVPVDLMVSCMEPIVVNMHHKSGLIEALRGASTDRLTALDTIFSGLVKQWCALYNNGEMVPLCGSSVHFDRAFMKVHMPKTEAAFHYRNIDVSGVREMVKLWNPAALMSVPIDRKIHRVDPDLEDTIELAKWCRSVMIGKLSA